MNQPKPIAIRELEGNPSRRQLPKVPQPSGKAEQPEWLGEQAKELWQRNAQELENLGLLTGLDGPAFAALCTWYSAFRHYAELHEQALGPADAKVVFSRMRDSSAELRRWSGEFGLSPVARMKLAIKGHEDEYDPFADLISTT